MAMGKQGGIAKANVKPAMPGSKSGGKVVGGGMVKKGLTPKGIPGNKKSGK